MRKNEVGKLFSNVCWLKIELDDNSTVIYETTLNSEILRKRDLNKDGLIDLPSLLTIDDDLLSINTEISTDKEKLTQTTLNSYLNKWGKRFCTTLGI